MKIKSKLLTLIVMFLLSGNTLAEPEKTSFYLKTGIAMMKNNTIGELLSSSTPDTIRSKSKYSPLYSLGIGYYFSDSIRGDFVFGANFIDFKEGHYTLYRNTGISKFVQKRKANIYSAMFNCYVDVIKLSDFSLFAGAGTGIAQLMENVRVNTSEYTTANILFDQDRLSRYRECFNFTYSLIVGGTIKLNDSFKLDIAYNYQDYGKLKPRNDPPTLDYPRYKGHVVGIGLRFDI
jgi:opacity protein-like surface antigen